MASPIFITTSARLAEEVQKEVQKQLLGLERSHIAREALEKQGAIVLAASVEEAVEMANLFAPEHLCLMVKEPWRYLDRVKNAGGIFLGESSPEVLGDYVAGPSHVMPTGGTARFTSPLGVDDFVRRISVVDLKAHDIGPLCRIAATIARAEGLTAHARSAEMRLRKTLPRPTGQRSPC